MQVVNALKGTSVVQNGPKLFKIVHFFVKQQTVIDFYSRLIHERCVVSSGVAVVDAIVGAVVATGSHHQ